MKNLFATNESEKIIEIKEGGQFGLNRAFVSLFEFNPNAGKDGSPADAVDINILVKDREYRSRLYMPTSLLDKDGNKIYPEDEEKYAPLFDEFMSQMIAVIKHVLKAVSVTQKQIDLTVQSIDPNDIVAGIQTLVNLAPSNYKTFPVDVFLEYQWNIPTGKTITYLDIPKNMKGGYFIVPEIKGNFQSVINEETGILTYVNEKGEEHIFTRSKNYMEGPRANQQNANKSKTENNPLAKKESSSSDSAWS